MGRGSKARHYTYNRRKVISNYKDCERDEDYEVSENESEDEYSSFLEDTSEESLGEYEDKEMVEKVVRKNVRPKASKRQTNGVVKRRKRKRDVYRGEDENDYSDDDDGDDEEFTLYEINRVVKQRKRKRVVYREEDNDEDDDDDREFTPDEIDGIDNDEYELPMTRGEKKLRKPQLTKGDGKRMQRKRISKASKKITRKKNSKNKNSKVSKKTTGKKRRTKCRVKRKARRIDDGDGESKKTRKNTGLGRRKRKIRIDSDSDSDFVSSGSSDLEYTISEEEREQVREAGKLTATLRRRASLKNLPEEKTPRLQKKRSLRKDKEKVEELKTEAGKQVCGICLSEEGKKTVCGSLNCCTHYFCFACIMEWSKVESRCPLCKQRFVTISKSAKSSAGFGLRPVVIQVPERDQVYKPSEEEVRGYVDPYENVICTECQQGGDDALMLLCDICDSAAHTYCVGLGHEVPEGNWYCEGCTSISPAGFPNPNPQNSNLTTPESRRTVSVNMRETFGLNEMYVAHTPLARDAQAASPAFTVSERRRIHRRINQFLSDRMRQVDSRTRDND